MTSATHSPFIWYELLTTDVPAALRFYSQLLGWTSEVMASPSGPYHIVSAGGSGVGGLMELPAAARAQGAAPHWEPYIGVHDIDERTRRVAAGGGKVHMPPTEIPGIGRFASVADPQGAPFMMMTPASAEAPPQPAPFAPGTVGWHELHARDAESALGFYAGMFGWKPRETLDMGPAGTYRMFATREESEGGVMDMMPGAPAPMWLFYFCVDALDAAVARARAGGASVMLEAQEVPGGMWVAVLADPQGAPLGLVSPKR